MRQYTRPRSLWGAAVFLLGLWACGGGTEGEPPPPAPPAGVDRELWGVRLELHQPGTDARVVAPYLRDDEELQTSWADSGAQVAFYDSAGQLSSQVSAGLLALDRGTGQWTLGRGVVATGPESLEVRADTLVWEQQTGKLSIPGRVVLRVPEGSEAGEELQAGLDFAEWSLRRVSGQWRGEGYQVHIAARSETGHRRGGRFSADYDSVTLDWDGVRLSSGRASFVSGQGRVYFTGGVQGVDSARTFAANALECWLAEQEVVARGQVQLEERELRLWADELRQQRQARTWQAWGEPARIERGERAIQARLLSDQEEGDQVEAVGEVVFREGERRLAAGKLRYRHRAGQLEASAEVTLRDPAFEGVASGSQLSFDLNTQQAQLRGNARLQRHTGEELRLSAGELDFALEARELRGRQGFEVQGRDSRLLAREGSYRSDLEELSLAGQAELRHEHGDLRTVLRADTLRVKLVEGRLAQIAAPGPLKGTFQILPDQAGWLEAGEGVAVLEGGELVRLELGGKAEVIRQQNGEASRFLGNQVTLHFVQGRLQRVVIEGGAELWARLREEGRPAALNHAKGEKLEVLAAEDNTFEMSGSAGTYYRPAEE
ncbi:MAG: hypothetical protein IT369_24120 [Candidatus Latescibacteria bacterium]|nr:hypothetical protein [Candidatus Latescibacterota bacterium]